VTEGVAPVVADVRPTPEDDELAAIVAAIELAWPRPAAPTVADTASRWRFSGRWWTRPVPTRRDRP
jgi:hypothetical protein